MACAMFVAPASPYLARFVSVVGCAWVGDASCGFSAGFSFGLCAASGIASGGVIGIVSFIGGAGAGLGVCVASTLGDGGVMAGSGIDGAEFTRFAWIDPCGPFTPHSFPWNFVLAKISSAISPTNPRCRNTDPAAGPPKGSFCSATDMIESRMLDCYSLRPVVPAPSSRLQAPSYRLPPTAYSLPFQFDSPLPLTTTPRRR